MKYTLSETEEKMWLGHTLHKVIYDVDWLKENEIDEEDAAGGWIESENNLSQDDLCMVADNAIVYGDARVCGDAMVCGNAIVYGDAMVCGDAIVYGNARVYGDARVCGDAIVYGDARVYGNARVCGDAMVCGNARVYGNAMVCGDAIVYGNARVSQCCTTSLKISNTRQWFEYQLEKIKLQEKWNAEEKEK